MILSWFDLNYMKANPEKFQFILFGKDNNSTHTLLPGVTLESLIVVKLLGVKIDFYLKFDEHVSVLCSKASRQINVLKTLSKTLDQNGKLKKKMQSCILCYFSYCPVLWHYCSKESILKMEISYVLCGSSRKSIHAIVDCSKAKDFIDRSSKVS